MKFIDILNEYNIPHKTEGQHHHCRPGWIQIDCPYCGKDSQKWHLGYSIESNYFNCWQCGGHSFPEVLVKLTGLSYRKCKKLLHQIDLPLRGIPKAPTGRLELPQGLGELRPIHKKYLKSRGFNPDEIQRLWKIQGIGIASWLSWRIFIPIHYQSQVVSWTTRSISSKEGVMRYISAPPKKESIPHKTLLYGEDFARDGIVVTEGCLDVWKIGPGAVGTFGTGYNQAQVERMVRYRIRAVCLDKNKEAQKRARKLVNDLSAFPGETYNIELDSGDPADATTKEIEEIREHFLE